MEWAWRVGKLHGVDIKIHFTFIFALVWGARAWGDGTGAALYGVVLTIALFAFVLLHEFGHALAAQHYGIRVHDIVLLPIGGIARLSRMPEKPQQELVVALAGPAVNLALILAAAPLVVAGLGGQLLAGGPVALPGLGQPGWIGFAWFVVAVNLSLLLFNLIPAFPMDGGRVLRALLAMRLRHSRATRVAALVGKVFAVLFGIAGLMTGNWMLVILAVFVFFGAGAEDQEAVLREALQDLRLSQVVDRTAPALSASLPAHAAFLRLQHSPYRALPVLDDQGSFVGLVTRGGMQRGWAAGQRGIVAEFVEPEKLRLDCDASVDETRLRMAESDAMVAVVFCGGRFDGLIDAEMIGHIVRARLRDRRFDPSRVPVSHEA